MRCRETGTQAARICIINRQGDGSDSRTGSLRPQRGPPRESSPALAKQATWDKGQLQSGPASLTPDTQ